MKLYFYAALLGFWASSVSGTATAPAETNIINIDNSSYIEFETYNGVSRQRLVCTGGVPVTGAGWEAFRSLEGFPKQPELKQLLVSLPYLSITKTVQLFDGSVQTTCGFPMDVPTFCGETEPYVGGKYATLVRDSQKSFKRSYPVYAQFPEGDAPCPLVIVLHGSGGIDGMMTEYMDALSKTGFASIAMNRFAGIMQDSSEDQQKLLPEQEVMMTFTLRELFSTHPRLQGQPCHLMGFSRGANVALDCMQQRHTELYEHLFESAICYYALPLFQWPLDPGARILFLHGEDDDYTCAGPLKKYLQTLNPDMVAASNHFTPLGGRYLDDTPCHTHLSSRRPEDPRLEAYFYDDAGHSFDGFFGQSLTTLFKGFLYEWMGYFKSPVAENYSDACVIATPEGFIPLGDGDASEGEREIKPWTEILSYLPSKVTRGVSVKLNQLAAKHAFGQALRWMREAN